jgi:hypothetical protein
VSRGQATRCVSELLGNRSSLLLPSSPTHRYSSRNIPVAPPHACRTPPGFNDRHPAPSTLDRPPPNCPLERPEAPGPQAIRLAMGNVGSRLDDGSPLYLKDQTRCKADRPHHHLRLGCPLTCPTSLRFSRPYHQLSRTNIATHLSQRISGD